MKKLLSTTINLAVLLLFVSCNNDKIGKYLYINPLNRTLHTKCDCPEVFRDVSDKTMKRCGLERIDTFDVTGSYYYCPKCFNDAQYEHVQRMIKRNEKINEDISRLYDIFKSCGYDMESYSEFCDNLKDPAKRKSAYDTLIDEGRYHKTFEEFEKRLGY